MSIEKIKIAIQNASQYKSFINKILSGTNVSLKGLPGSLRALLITILSNHLQRPILVVISDRTEAEQLLDELNELVTENYVGFFPGGGEDPDVSGNPRASGASPASEPGGQGRLLCPWLSTKLKNDSLGSGRTAQRPYTGVTSGDDEV